LHGAGGRGRDASDFTLGEVEQIKTAAALLVEKLGLRVGDIAQIAAIRVRNKDGWLG
jgi:hypothetical protein